MGGKMEYLRPILQLIVGLTILNVWCIRYNWKTAYRGGKAQSLKEEFMVYGLPVWAFYVIGAIKVCAAALLVTGIFLPIIVFPAVMILAIMMSGAVSMHVLVGDGFKKMMPAFTILMLNFLILTLI